MKSYTSKLIRRESEKKIFAAKEGRDAIIDSIFVSDRYSLLRIQGSDTLIYTPWAENWDQAPPFLRVGNAVRIHHPKGNPNMIEITGNANTIPTPIGGISILPDQETSDDVVITGCNTLAHNGMIVLVEAGTYRIDGVIYTLGNILMGNSAFGTMGNEPTFLMGSTVGGLVEIATAPSSPNYRIDMLSVNASGIINYTQGTPHATDPENPTLPSAEALITYIIVPYDVTTILQAWIGESWTAPYLRTFTSVMDEFEMHWIDGATNTGTIELRNQYDKLVIGNYNITVKIISGNGTIDDEYPTETYNITSGTMTFTYERGMIDFTVPPYTPLDVSPTIHSYITTKPAFTMQSFILLYDSADEPMLG